MPTRRELLGASYELADRLRVHNCLIVRSISLVLDCLERNVTHKFRNLDSSVGGIVRAERSIMILHVNNTAGVGSVLAKYQRREETSLVVAKTKGDVCGHHRTYGGVLSGDSTRFAPIKSPLYYGLVGLFAPIARYVHVHGTMRNWKCWRILDGLKKPRILEYHGYLACEIEQPLNPETLPNTKVIVSTPNLLKYFRDAQWLPNPVDTELFRDLGFERVSRGFACIKGSRDYMLKHLKPTIDEIAREYDIDLDVWRADKNLVPHRLMPYMYNNYEFFIDIAQGYDRKHAILEAYSLMGLQALACGCKVITTWDGIKKGLPTIHRADNVVNQLEKIAQEI